LDNKLLRVRLPICHSLRKGLDSHQSLIHPSIEVDIKLWGQRDNTNVNVYESMGWVASPVECNCRGRARRDIGERVDPGIVVCVLVIPILSKGEMPLYKYTEERLKCVGGVTNWNLNRGECQNQARVAGTRTHEEILVDKQI